MTKSNKRKEYVLWNVFNHDSYESEIESILSEESDFFIVKDNVIYPELHLYCTKEEIKRIRFVLNSYKVDVF